MLRRSVSIINSKNSRTGGCHCGAVRFEVTLSDDLKSVRRCNCSYCRMRGSVIAAVAPGGIKILRGGDILTSYRFNTRKAQHFFCSRCGIHTHHQRRSDPNRHAVNVACLEGVSPFDFPEVPVMNGINHPNDTGKPAHLAGILRFESMSAR
ncbi:GFA family protein [Acetobacter ascendens]|uniref:Centromere protein n=1 Tax=Acetobacter ascendens TaxID=481146 RepID=A0A1Y0V0N9_9PROT|nr:Centromere protein [Acetobacter ascendens]